VAILPLVQHKWLKWSCEKHNTLHIDTTCWGLELWLSLYFTQHRQKAIKSLPALKLGVTVSYIDHAFQTCNVFWTCHMITSNNCVQLLTKNFRTLSASWDKIDMLITFTSLALWRPPIKHFCPCLQRYNLPTDSGRELFRPFMDSACLQVQIEKNYFVLGVGFSMGVVRNGGVFSSFLPTLPGPGCQTNEPIFWLKVFLERRSSPESLDSLMGFPAHLESRLWLKNQKMVKNFTPTNANIRRKAPQATDGYNSLSECARDLFKPSKYSWSLVVCN